MGPARDRAVAVALHDGMVLVVRRRRHGRGYCVLPGGGVEPGESPADAAVRELREETGLVGVVERHLWTIEHTDRTAYYFSVDVDPGPMTVGGPEASSQSDDNHYLPAWIALDGVDVENLQPEPLRQLLRGLRAHATGPADQWSAGWWGGQGRRCSGWLVAVYPWGLVQV